MKIENQKKAIYLFSILLLNLFIFLIVFFTMGNLDFADYIAGFMHKMVVPVYLLTGAIFLFAFVYLVGEQIAKGSPKQIKIISAIIGIIIFFIQMAVVFYIRSPLRSDPGMVFDQALDMFKTQTISPTAIENYFSIYPNNIPLCIMEHLLLKLGSLFGLSYEHYLLYLDIINTLFIDVAMYFTYRIIKSIKSGKAAVKFMVLCAINPLLYAYSVLVYTSTLSMPFIMGTIYFFLRGFQAQKEIQKRSYYVVTAIILYFGYQLRVTVLISLVAIILYVLLQKNDVITKEKWIRITKRGLLVVVTILVASSIYHGVEKKYVKFDTSQTAFPITHWLMMGAQGSGGFNTEDFNFTLNIPTKEERIHANLIEYKNRLANMGITGTSRLILNKLKVTWSDGLDATIDTLSANKTYYEVNDYISGSKKDVYASYCHMYNLMLMILLLFSTLKGLKRKKEDFYFILYLNVLGGIIFHLFWEAGAAYNICFTFLVLALANDGQETYFSYLEHKKGYQIRFGVYLCGMIATVGLLLIGYKNMVEVPFKQHKLAVNQDFHENECEPLRKGDELIQTFKTARPFNRIGVKVRNFLGDANKSSYKIELLDEEGNILVSDEVVGSLAFDTDYYRIPIETIVPTKSTTYQLKLTTKKADKENNIVFMMYNRGNWNVYEDGTLSVNGEEVLGSLTFQAYESVEEAFFSKKMYFLFAGTVLIGEVILFYGMVRRKDKIKNLK